jgi:hypothetical protein
MCLSAAGVLSCTAVTGALSVLYCDKAGVTAGPVYDHEPLHEPRYGVVVVMAVADQELHWMMIQLNPSVKSAV